MDPQTVAQRFFDDTIRMEVSEELFSPEVVLHNYFLARTEVRGIDRVRAAFGLVYGAVSDARVTIHEVLGDGDRIAVRHTHEGTFSRSLLSVPPTGKPIMFDGVELFRMADAKIAEIWNFDDNATLMRQLGLLEGSEEYS